MATARVSDEQLQDILARYVLSDHDFYRECVMIRDHFTQTILPLELNRSQRIIEAIVDKQKAQKGFVRCFILKSRRVGASTFVESRFYKRTSLAHNVSTFIVAHEEDSTKTLYGMARLMQEKNPYAPKTRYSSAQELVFDTSGGEGLHSQYRLATAKNVDAGRSQGIHNLHGSEVAMWDNAEELLAGLLQTIPPPPADTEVYLESTAKGYGNYFQRGVFKAYAEGAFPFYEENGIPYAWGSPGTDFIVIFIPWFVHEIYTKPFDSEEQRKTFEKALGQKVFDKESLTWVESQESILQRKFSLTLEQLNWRQWCIQNNCQDRVEIFQQEYPSTVEEAFLSRGTMVYSRQLCDMLEEQCIEPLLQCEVVERAGVPKVRPSAHGSCRIYKKPNPARVCFITVDSAGGIKKSQEERQVEPDPTCIDVWDHESGEQLAQWQGHIDYDLIGELVDRIGRLYAYRAEQAHSPEQVVSLPIACVELNNHGYTVVADLKRLKYPMYEAHPGEPGWQTTMATRPRMIDDAAACCRDGSLQVRCKETVSEMRTFVEKGGGRQEAEEGCHDERVMTLGMASQMVKLLPRYLQPIKGDEVVMPNWKRPQPGGWDGHYQEIRT